MILKGTPRKAGLQQERCTGQENVQRSQFPEEKEWDGEDQHGKEPEEQPCGALETGRITGGFPPPADKPAKQCYGVIRGLGIADHAIDNQSGSEHDNWCCYREP
jgi:hypothetical protein